ncbi:ATP-grasp domain-containing protein [Fusobacterium periodonticum]|jgi:phosphoribosylglycinamide synthetase, ATP-grasp (A) domain|uniref:ATP-grasp domain-containing protein n=1 Tax=Fusobacterium periodonticum TaxID=860 RepID=UPI00352C82FA
MKIAIIGANEFQNKLIIKAKEMGIETHVFAWEEGAVGKENSDFFYPISIIEKEKILEICKKIKIDGICSIASDLAMHTVNFVANELNLKGNSLECTELTTNKYKMRERLSKSNLPCPKYILVNNIEKVNLEDLSFPLIVKPTDRSGSRGIYKVNNESELEPAIKSALEESFSKEILIEEYILGDEYSVESISEKGIHKVLQITKKYTTGAPNFIERGHIEPVEIDDKLYKKIEQVILKSLDILEVSNGASHSEIKILENDIKIVEIGARMGGDFIGSDLVKISTGIDYLELVINIALNRENVITNIAKKNTNKIAVVKFIFNVNDKDTVNRVDSKNIIELYVKEEFEKVKDSSTRNGYCLMEFENTKENLKKIEEEILL